MSAESQGEPARSRTRRLFALLAEALRGSNRDLTSGPLAPAVFVLAVPMALEMVGESIFAVVDALFIARLGAPALASAGITETALELVYAVAIGFSFAVTAVVSRRCGEGDRRGAARAGVQSIFLGLGPFPELGLPGAAVATTIGRGCGVLYQLRVLSRGDRLRILREDVRVQWGVVKNLCRVSIGGIAQMLADVLPWVVLIRIIASFGTVSVAGWVIAVRVALFVIL